MIPKSLVGTVVLISLGMGCLLSANAEEVRDACAQIALPSGVQKALRTKFPGWKIESVSDLHPHYRDLWLKAHPSQCPGIAIGHFQNKAEFSYAVLLVPTDKNTHGYKLVVVSGDPQGRYEPKILESWRKPLTSDVVINRVPPGEYSDPEDDQRVRLTLDSIHFEQMEVGGALFFWRGGRYRKLIVSD